jgi:large subunit ribosomal protein L21
MGNRGKFRMRQQIYLKSMIPEIAVSQEKSAMIQNDKPALTILRGDAYNWSSPQTLGGEMYAVIKTGGKQYRVAPGDTVRIERVEGKVGEKVNFGEVLAIHGDKQVFVGAEAAKATVTGKIVEQGRAKKLTVLKFKRTNQYKIQRGHRQNFTAVQVSDIKL